MSDEAVCGYCGRANGWHLWGCPNLELRFSTKGLVMGYINNEEAGVVKPIVAKELLTMPGVE